MNIIQFENEPVKTIFAPVFKFDMYEDHIDLKDIKSTILSKEREVISMNISPL